MGSREVNVLMWWFLAMAVGNGVALVLLLGGEWLLSLILGG